MEESFNIEDIVFKTFKPSTLSREEWTMYHEFRRIIHEQKNPDDPFTEDSIMEKSLESQEQHPEKNQ